MSIHLRETNKILYMNGIHDINFIQSKGVIILLIKDDISTSVLWNHREKHRHY